jgi:hypothetical protein
VVPNASEPADKTDRAEVVDRILDKISEKGYDSLSDEEKMTLLDASQKE